MLYEVITIHPPDEDALHLLGTKRHFHQLPGGHVLLQVFGQVVVKYIRDTRNMDGNFYIYAHNL